MILSLTLSACGVNHPIESALTPGPSPSAQQNTGNSAPSATSTAQVYESCQNSDPGVQCIGLKIVSYENSGVPPVLDQTAAMNLVHGINAVWAQCKVAFQLEKFEITDPITKGLSYSPNWRTDSTQIRSTFQEPNEFLVVAVGPWSTSTIAVTEMPGYGPFGTLVDQQYATNPLTVGHELGHYMGLYHVSDSSNLMNPYIGPNTENLNPSQCATARSTNLQNWSAMLR